MSAYEQQQQKKRCTELIKSPEGYWWTVAQICSCFFCKKCNLSPKRSHVIFTSGAETRSRVKPPPVCSSYTSNPLFVFPSPPQRREKKTPDAFRCSNGAHWCNSVSFEKHLQQFLYRAPPRSSAVFKTQRTFDRHAWCIFFSPSLNRSQQCILKNLGERLQIKDWVWKNNFRFLYCRHVTAAPVSPLAFKTENSLQSLARSPRCSNPRPADQCNLNLRAWIIIEALASID